MPLLRGDPAPWVTCRSPSNENYRLAAVGGRYVVLVFLGSAATPESQAFLGALVEHRKLYDDQNICCFLVTNDPTDETTPRLKNVTPGIRVFWDFDNNVAKQFKVLEKDENGKEVVAPQMVILDWRLRVLDTAPLDPPEKMPERITRYVSTLPVFGEPVAATVQAPILIVPNIFEKEFCAEMIEYYKTNGGLDSGYMKEIEGKTVGIYDYSVKRRMDCKITDDKLQRQIRARVARRLVPEVKKAFQFDVTHMERYIIGCYEGETGGFFNPHRDNTTRATAHRNFAVTLNLNAEEYEGGNLRFPEFGPHYYRAPTGGAVIFSCTLMHEAQPVTKGTRYVFLPFLFGAEGAKIRAENQHYIVSSEPPGNTLQTAGVEKE